MMYELKETVSVVYAYTGVFGISEQIYNSVVSGFSACLCIVKAVRLNTMITQNLKILLCPWGVFILHTLYSVHSIVVFQSRNYC